MGKTRNRLKRKAVSVAIAAIWLWGLAGPAFSAPQGGSVVSGKADIIQSGTVTNVNQSTNAAAINWTSFSVKANERVNFNQPNALSITLNRVTGSEQSIIQGVINATGRVFLVNSNGILFSKGSSVNASGFLASNLNITDENFNAGKYVFTSQGSKGSVVNQGAITARDGGYVALLGTKVSNQGTITATKGTVALASGNKVTLNFNGDSLLGVTVDEGVLNVLVENKGAIYTDGGTVVMTAMAADDLLTAQVNNSGLIQARTIDDLKGSIVLDSHGGVTRVTGTLDASAPGSGDSGSIQTSGGTVKIADTAYITTASDMGRTGTWLIASNRFTVGAGSGNISGAALSSALESNNVTIQSTQSDIKLNGAVTWSGNTTLSLNASKDIYFNRSLTGTGTYAGLALTYGGDYYIRTPASYSGAVLRGNTQVARRAPGGEYAAINLTGSNASLTINGNKYTLIHSMDELAGTGTASGYYALAGNLDAEAWSRSNVGAASVVGTLSGTLAGLGHTVSNLTLNAPTSNYVGLIGQTSSSGMSVIRDIGVVNANITGRADVGALLGVSNGAAVSNAYVTATKGNVSTVSGSTGSIGGLIGGAWGGATTITSSYSDANVTAMSTVTMTGSQSSVTGLGGLIGQGTNVTIANCHATGNVTAPETAYGTDIGGLIGGAVNSTVSNSYATGNVVYAGGMSVGGLIGSLVPSSSYTGQIWVTNSFATGNVTGRYDVGGLIGHIEGKSDSQAKVDRSYAAGNVTATGSGDNGQNVGGMVGYGHYTDISNSHSTGNVGITSKKGIFNYMGGLVGQLLNGSITKSYATGNVTGNGQTKFMGGLVGSVTGGSITSCHATGDVTGGRDWTGGLAGTADGIYDSWASGNVSGYRSVGGLAGSVDGPISDSYAIGNVNGQEVVGGLIGLGANGTIITDSYAMGKVNGVYRVGGLAGILGADTHIIDSYSTGPVNGVDMVGGLAGMLGPGSSIEGSYAMGPVYGKTSVGGLVGQDSGSSTTITNSYWNGTGGIGAVGSSVENGTTVTGSGNTVITGSQGLSGDQIHDVQYYMNGTIDKVLAERAIVEAMQAAAEAAAHSQGERTIGQTVQADASPSKETRAAAALAGRSGASFDDHIIFGDSDSYSAHIKAISADGVGYDLEDDSKGDKKQPGAR